MQKYFYSAILSKIVTASLTLRDMTAATGAKLFRF